MLTDVRGDMLKQAPKGDVIVIPVNTVGAAGKQLAAYMKLALPSTYERYLKACKRGTIATGEMVVTCEKDWWVACFPTKYHWKRPSDTGLMEISLRRLVTYMEEHNLSTVHMPRIGCGKYTGTLNYDTEVRPLIAKYFEDSELTAVVYDR